MTREEAREEYDKLEAEQDEDAPKWAELQRRRDKRRARCRELVSIICAARGE